VTPADLNRDGKPDLAVANCGANCGGSGSGDVSVLLGNGDGTFGARTDIETGAGPVSVAAADLNRDGDIDLVSANMLASSVSVLLGNGDGTFATKTDIATTHAGFVAVGDFNRDAKPDLGVASGNAITVLLGNGDGTFGSKTDYGIASDSTALAVADLNGDGSPDLAAASYFTNSVSVLLGKADGTFGASTEYSTDTPTYHASRQPFCESVGITSSDLNGDGKPDLAIARALAFTVAVLLGHGDGTFAPVRDFHTGAPSSLSIAAADLNRDGRPDLLTNHSALLNTSADGVTLTAAALTATRPRLVRLPLANPNPFAVTGNVTLRTASGKPILTLGRSSFAIAATKTSSVSVKLSKAGAALLAKRKTLRARVALVTRAPGAPAITSAKVLRLTAR
jgi:hypothetical protein